MKSLYVTGAALHPEERFSRFLSRLGVHPPDVVEIRDKTADDRTLLSRLRTARKALPGTALFANGRYDLALAGGADGVILPADGLPIADVRRETPRGFRIGKSTHAAAEALAAFEQGADIVLLGPLFDTPSTRAFGPPLGEDVLASLPAARDLSGEIYVIGGVSGETIARLAPYRDRFTGIAAIRLFEEAPDPAAIVERIRAA